MRQQLMILLIVMLAITGLFFYCAALIDWVQDIRLGGFKTNQLEIILETAAIGFYTFCGMSFFRWKVSR